jgi:hypothetical protein
MQQPVDFFEEVLSKGKNLIQSVTVKDFIALIQTDGKSLVHGLIFLTECLAPILIYNFPLSTAALLVSSVIAFITAIVKRDTIENIECACFWIINRRPITLWILCYNLEWILGLLLYTIESNMYAILFIAQLIIVDICHYV